MEIQEGKLAEMLAYEAFIRRAAALGKPFMLKGSYVTRQYYEYPENRIPADLDWVYMETLSGAEEAERVFNEWATAVTEAGADDGVAYTSFSENAFWRMIDYAMADDFPTVNTELSCRVDDQVLDCLGLDISFNLDIEAPAVPLLYKPLRGEPFMIPFTAPLSLQVSWKIHQTLVRPRFKDLLDLIALLYHPSWNKDMLAASVQALVNECAADRIDLRRLRLLLSGDIKPLFPHNTLEKTWDFWRHDAYSRNITPIAYDDQGKHLTDVSKLPETWPQFIALLTAAFQHAGWNAELAANLPQSSRQQRKGYQQPDPVSGRIESERIEAACNDDAIRGERDENPSLLPGPSAKRRFRRWWYALFK